MHYLFLPVYLCFEKGVQGRDEQINYLEKKFSIYIGD